MKRLSLIMLIPVLVCPGCGTLTRSLMNANMFSTQEEVTFGMNFTGEIEKDLKLVTDPSVVARVEKMGAQVAAKSPRQDVTYVFKVVDKPDEVNAFAVPGGFIYIYSGLLNKVDSDDELAGVLAHEVGHVAAKHSMKQMTRKMGYDYISKALLGAEAPQWQLMAKDLAGTVGFLKFSRDQEREADRLGVEIMHEAGYDPRGLQTFIGKLVDMEEREPSPVERMLATHPGPRERRTNISLQIEKMISDGELPAKPK